jgi:hypothetical protein
VVVYRRPVAERAGDIGKQERLAEHTLP